MPSTRTGPSTWYSPRQPDGRLEYNLHHFAARAEGQPARHGGVAATDSVELTAVGYHYRRMRRDQLAAAVDAEHNAVTLNADRAGAQPTGRADVEGRFHVKRRRCQGAVDINLRGPSDAADDVQSGARLHDEAGDEQGVVHTLDVEHAVDRGCVGPTSMWPSSRERATGRCEHRLVAQPQGSVVAGEGGRRVLAVRRQHPRAEQASPAADSGDRERGSTMPPTCVDRSPVRVPSAASRSHPARTTSAGSVAVV